MVKAMTTQTWLSHTRQNTTSKIYGHSIPLTTTYLSTSTTIPAFGFSVGYFIEGLNPIGELIEALPPKCRSRALDFHSQIYEFYSLERPIGSELHDHV